MIIFGNDEGGTGCATPFEMLIGMELWLLLKK